MIDVQDESSRVIIFDTTLRDGDLTPGVNLTIAQKLELAELLEAMRVDVLEVGYPGAYRKDFDALFMVSKRIKQATVCGLANSIPEEIIDVALAIKPATRGRIHIYTPVHQSEHETLTQIAESIQLARHYRDDVEWSAFNALKSDRDFLCRSIETAIHHGATTISIPDTLGTATPEQFSELIRSVIHRVPNIEQAAIAVHCHDDCGLAVTNSIAALDVGVRQIECAVNGLGARKGNADLAAVVSAISAKRNSEGTTDHPNYNTIINSHLLNSASELLTQMTGIPRRLKV
ncbi:2-isopropylmalate synthase [Cyanobacteria bacterium FACHB-63]|nr:2-isopropylmalate synthase [Cyanobacteria bacterium FACHB-63]